MVRRGAASSSGEADVESTARNETGRRVAPTVDRNRCEAKGECVRVCPYGVFAIGPLSREDRATLSLRGRLKTWAHGGKQAHVVNPGACDACRLCLAACPEGALELTPMPAGWPSERGPC